MHSCIEIEPPLTIATPLATQRLRGILRFGIGKNWITNEPIEGQNPDPTVAPQRRVIGTLTRESSIYQCRRLGHGAVSSMVDDHMKSIGM